jgi:hypothetical protein
MRSTNHLRARGSIEQSGRLLAALVGVFLLSGCAEKQVRVRPWATAVAVRPHLAGPLPAGEANLDILAPELSWPLPPLFSPLAIAKQPIRPRVPAPPVPESTGSSKPSAPLLEPELTPQEVAAAQQQMNESIVIAQKNLAAAKGRRLNPTQADLTSKVTAFLQESKQAVHDGDWTRARNLAKKARILSEELAASL